MTHDTGKAAPFQSRKSGPLKGVAPIPGDKSISHRALMLSSLCKGTTTVHGLLEGEDVLNTAAAMRAMGAKIEKQADGSWICEGVGIGELKEPSAVIDMGNSGTSTRLLAGLIAGHQITAFFTGDASLIKRPMGRVITPLKMMGANFMAREGGRLPMGVQGSSKLQAIDYALPVASAQVKSAILLAGLDAQGTTRVIETKPTRDHTENMLRHFGIHVEIKKREDGAEIIELQGGQRMRTSDDIHVPSDPSSAAFPAVAAVLCDGSDIVLPAIGMNPRRNGIFITLQEMGADIVFENERIEAGEKVADIHVRGGRPLKGVTVPEERVPSMIDEFPVLAVAASYAQGDTVMTGLEELRVKESDRLLMIANGLKACGVVLQMGYDSLTIHGNGAPPAGGATIETALDHRIAMSFLVMGMASADPVQIDDVRPINTSFPGFVNLINELCGTDILQAA